VFHIPMSRFSAQIPSDNAPKIGLLHSDI
jgi:hypothetical protein